MDAETFARALQAALVAEGLIADDEHGDLTRVRIAGVADLTAVARRLRAAPPRSRRPSSLDQPPSWLSAYP